MIRSQVLTIGVDKVTMEQAVQRCRQFLADGRPHLVVTPNAEIVYAASRNGELAGILNRADLVVPDGAGVVLASRILGDPVPEKVAGADLATRLLDVLQGEQGTVYLLGARPEVVAEATRRIRAEYPGLTVYGRDGFFTLDQESAVIADIRQKRPQALLVGMGSPRQERWLAAHLAALDVPLCMGVGGTIDVWGGAAQRAPKWMIRANLEWLYRIVKFGRYGRSLPPLVKFLFMVIAQRMRGH